MIKYFIYILVFFCLTINAQTSNEEKKVYNTVDEMPSFPKGTEAMMKFIQKKIIFPKSAIEKKIIGKCFLTFVVEPDGSIKDITVRKGVENCSECDEAAIDVISKMPKWNPGKKDGVPVSVYFNLPINFKYK